MIVSYEGIRGGILLREVNTEEEAFAEMRRYLKVNRISSTYTEVYWQKVNENIGVLTGHKRVAMARKPSGGATFGIYYEGRPTHLELGSEEKWGIKRPTPPFVGFNPDYYFRGDINENVCWYDEVAAYFDDLEKRKAGGE